MLVLKCLLKYDINNYHLRLNTTIFNPKKLQIYFEI